MRFILALAALAAVTALFPAAAQSYEGSVTVNPYGGRVLIDPGTGRQRVLPPLVMPGENEAPIKLHPIWQHHKARTAVRPRRARPVAAAPQHRERTVRAARPQHKERTARAAPPPQRAPAAQTPASRGLANLDNLVASTASQPAPKPAKPTRRPPPKVLPPRRPPAVEKERPAAKTRTASIAKPVKPHREGGKARGVILFAANASDPSTTAVEDVRSLAADLNNALSDSSARVEVKAYAGERGEKTSDTRRMSLKRALIVRQLLIDDGVPAERIDVFALGGVEDSGPTDRVDIFLKG